MQSFSVFQSKWWVFAMRNVFLWKKFSCKIKFSIFLGKCWSINWYFSDISMTFLTSEYGSSGLSYRKRFQYATYFARNFNIISFLEFSWTHLFDDNIVVNVESCECYNVHFTTFNLETNSRWKNTNNNGSIVTKTNQLLQLCLQCEQTFSRWLLILSFMSGLYLPYSINGVQEKYQNKNSGCSKYIRICFIACGLLRIT